MIDFFRKQIAGIGYMALGLFSMIHMAHGAGLPPAQKPVIDKTAIALTALRIPLSHKDHTISTIGKLRYMGGLKITSPNRNFGGISSLIISPDGQQILAVTDHDQWLTAHMKYDEKGQLIDLDQARMAPLKKIEDKTQNNIRDAEAIAAVDGAGYIVSFESPHALRYYQADSPLNYGSVFSALPQKVSFAPEQAGTYDSLPKNLGLEALTSLADGRILGFSENIIAQGGKTWAQGWLMGHGRIESLRYEISPTYRPTDMATLPDGDILVLERHFSLAHGMAARLTRLDAMSLRPGQSLKGEVIADLAYPLNMDNMEALAVRQNKAGETLIYIMSDNNFNRLQRNLLLMFKLDEKINRAAPKINGLDRILAVSN